MSTQLYYRCVTHDPYISSDEVAKKNMMGLLEAQSALKNRKTIVEKMEEVFESNGVISHDGRATNRYSFIYSHQNCEIEIWDGYGDQHPVEMDPVMLRSRPEEESIMRPGPYPWATSKEKESGEVEEPTAEEFVAYVRKPDVIKAIQWDGTVEGAVAVSKFLKEYLRTDFLSVHQEIYEGSAQRLYMTVTLHNGEERIYPTEWFIKEHGEYVTHMIPEDFERKYTKKES